jgi:hypothetical protein
MSPEIIASIFAGIAAIIAAGVALVGQRTAHRLELAFQQSRAADTFQEERLLKFYLPIARRLQLTKKLFHRYGQAGADEKVAIEHEMRRHNARIARTLIDDSIYLEPDAPEEQIDQLTAHLLQWEIVYQLKYKHQVYQGPVFAGISEFGFQGHPGLDDYFADAVKRLRRRHHDRLKTSAGNRDA